MATMTLEQMKTLTLNTPIPPSELSFRMKPTIQMGQSHWSLLRPDHKVMLTSTSSTADHPDNMKGMRLKDLRVTLDRWSASVLKGVSADCLIHDEYLIGVPLKEGPTNTMKKLKIKTKPKKASPLSNLGMYSTITKGIRDAVKELLENLNSAAAMGNAYDKLHDMSVTVHAQRSKAASHDGGTGRIKVIFEFDPLRLLGITS